MLKLWQRRPRRMSEHYAGIKFSLSLTRQGLEADSRCAEMISWCRELARRGLCAHGDGNLSFRCRPGELGFVITGAGQAFERGLRSEHCCLVKQVDISSGHVKAHGLVDPSSESMLHWCLYRARADVHAVVHGHGELAMECAQAAGHPVTRERVAYGSLELALQAEELARHSDVLVLREHGVVCLGSDLNEAARLALDLL